MGPEQTAIQNPATTGTYHQALNFLDLQGFDQKNDHKKGAASERTQALDFAGPVYPPEAPVAANNADQSPKTEAAKPANKYEAAVNAQVAGLAAESKFTDYTKAALSRDADTYPPVRDDKAGTTTYTIEQFGLTDRDLAKGQDKAEHYKRLVAITVPDDATSLKECKFAYQDRQVIDEKEFNYLVDSAQKRQVVQSEAADDGRELPNANDMAFYTHGIRTAAESSDFQALALQLTNGHSVINIDWKSTPQSEEKDGLCEAYHRERKGAAESYGRFEKALDDTIDHVGADRTDLIAFSHGAMFDTKYLRHRNEQHAPLLNEVILTHPDVPIAELPQPNKDGHLEQAHRLFTQTAKNTYVIGSDQDWALTGAAYNDCPPCKSKTMLEQWKEKNEQMAIHARIGNGAPISRTLVAGSGGTYVMETVPEDQKDPYKHFINMNGITKLINVPHEEAALASNK